MQYLLASVLVVATLFTGIVGPAFADQGDFDAPAHDKQVLTETTTDVVLGVPARGMLFDAGANTDIESKRIEH